MTTVLEGIGFTVGTLRGGSVLERQAQDKGRDKVSRNGLSTLVSQGTPRQSDLFAVPSAAVCDQMGTEFLTKKEDE